MSAKPKRKGSLISNILAGITGAFVVLLLGLQIYGQISAPKNFGVPVYGDKQVLVVLTDSMEPSYKVGTALFVEKIKDYSKIVPSSTLEAKDGDVLTFFSTRFGAPVTHRVVSSEVDANGDYVFYTLGDNLDAESCHIVYDGPCDPERSQDRVLQKDILGKVIGQSPGFGKVYSVMSKSYFILLFAIVPLFFVFFTSIVDLVKQLKPEREARAAHDELEIEIAKIKEQEKLKAYIEYEKEKMRQELEEGGKHDE